MYALRYTLRVTYVHAYTVVVTFLMNEPKRGRRCVNTKFKIVYFKRAIILRNASVLKIKISISDRRPRIVMANVYDVLLF